MNTYGYSRGYGYSAPAPKPKPPSQESRIGDLLRTLDQELSTFCPTNANAAFLVAIHTVRVAVKGLKKFF